MPKIQKAKPQPARTIIFSFQFIIQTGDDFALDKVSDSLLRRMMVKFQEYGNLEPKHLRNFSKHCHPIDWKDQRVSRSKQAKGTQKRHRCRKVVARVHERITNKRKDFTHKLSHKLVNSYGTIAIEDLSINDMQKDNFRCINKGIADVAWRNFFNLLTYKAEYAGRSVVKVNPAYTSQDCSRCGYRQKMPLSNRTFQCPCCSLSLDRDHNAAINIHSLGLQTVGRQVIEAPAFRHEE
jgi:IS605 OrfB family transposase